MENIIIVGHGSPRKEANNIDVIGRLLHAELHPGCSGQCVKTAYLQFSEPDIMTAIRGCIGSGATKLILHPFFLSSGMHVTTDIPGIIAEARGLYPEVEFAYTEPLGVHEKLVQIVIERIHAAGFSSPADIEKRSFEIISDEIDLRDVPSDVAPIVKRVIHSTADFDFKNTLAFHADAVRTGIDAIRAGRDILTDIEMVKTGINTRLLEKWGGNVICNIRDSGLGVSGLPPHVHGFSTRAAIGIESELMRNNNVGIIAIGNAPTALLKVIDLFLRNVLPSGVKASFPLVVGVPVGFVKALESKALLSDQGFPFITNLSRKGGTPVAVAIVNALLKMAAEE